MQESHLCILGFFPLKKFQKNKTLINEMVFITDDERIKIKLLLENHSFKHIFKLQGKGDNLSRQMRELIL